LTVEIEFKQEIEKLKTELLHYNSLQNHRLPPELNRVWRPNETQQRILSSKPYRGWRILNKKRFNLNEIQYQLMPIY